MWMLSTGEEGSSGHLPFCLSLCDDGWESRDNGRYVECLEPSKAARSAAGAVELCVIDTLRIVS